MKLSEKTKGILTVIGGFIFQLALGTVYSFGLLNPFMISYLYKFDNRVRPDDGFFLMPLSLLFHNFFVSIGGMIENIIGPRIVIICGYILICLSYLFMYFSTNIMINYISMVISGIGVGICYLAPVRTAWKYFPNNKGLCVGIILMGFGLSSTFLNFVLMAIINPKKLKADHITKIYPEEVADKVPTFLLTTLIIVFVFGTIGTILIIPKVIPKPVKKKEDIPLEDFKEIHENEIEYDAEEEPLEIKQEELFTIINTPPREIVVRTDNKLGTVLITMNEYEEVNTDANFFHKKKYSEGSLLEYNIALTIGNSPVKAKRKGTSTSLNRIKNNFRKQSSTSLKNKSQSMSREMFHHKLYNLALSHPKIKKSIDTHTLHVAILNFTTLRYCFYIFGALYLPSTLLNLIKPFSLFHQEYLTEDLIFWMSVGYSLINGLFRTLFGYLYDKIGIVILKFTIFLLCIIGGGIYFCSEVPGLFFAAVLCSALASSSTLSIIPASISKVFGVEYSSEVYGIVLIFYGLASLTSPVISKAISLSKSETDTPYLILFEIGCGLAFIAFLLLFTLKEKPFDFEQHYKNEVEEEEEKKEKNENIQYELEVRKVVSFNNDVEDQNEHKEHHKENNNKSNNAIKRVLTN